MPMVSVKENLKEEETVSSTEAIQNYYVCMKTKKTVKWMRHFLFLLLLIELCNLCMLSISL